MPGTRLDALFERSTKELQHVAARSAQPDERFLAADILDRRRQMALEREMNALTDDELESRCDDDDAVVSRAAEAVLSRRRDEAHLMALPREERVRVLDTRLTFWEGAMRVDPRPNADYGWVKGARRTINRAQRQITTELIWGAVMQARRTRAAKPNCGAHHRTIRPRERHAAGRVRARGPDDDPHQSEPPIRWPLAELGEANQSGAADLWWWSE